MENHMDTIISQLSQIEGTAVRILESADSQKKELALEMEQRTKDYDAELAKETSDQLGVLKKKLNAQKEEELSMLRAETSHTLEILEANFEKNHTAWAMQILNSITGAK